MNAKKNLSDLKNEIMRQHGVVVFFIVLIASNLLWKALFRGDEHNVNAVSLLGIWDISDLFALATNNLTNVVVNFLHFLNFGVYANGNYIALDHGNGVFIIWGCTAIKQMFIFACIILCSRGLWKHKAWFIPLGFVLIYYINVVRIAALAIIAENRPESVDFYHTYIFKYAFYGIIFLIWMVWDLFFAEKK